MTAPTRREDAGRHFHSPLRDVEPALKQPRVALIVDHPSRDLAGLVLTAMELCRRGVTCHLVPLNLMHDQLWTLAPDLVVLNYARPAHARITRQLLDAGIRVGVLDTEGAAWESWEAYRELLWTDQALWHELSFACMWGPALARQMVSTGLLLDSQVTVTGCPRFDFYHQRWREVFGGNSRPSRPVLLINTNFSFGNPRFASASRNWEQMQREMGVDADRLRACLEAETAALQGMITLARNLARDFSGCDVVLRPHPFEDPSPYLAGLAATPGVTVDGSGPIQSRLFGARAIIQRSCSTAAEAAMADVPTLSPQWLPAPALIPFAEAVSISCATYDQLRLELVRIMDRGGTSDEVAEARRASLMEWFFRLDGLAHRRVADTITERLPATRTVNMRACTANLYQLGDPTRSVGQRLGARVRYALRLSPAWAFRQWRVADGEAWRQSDKRFGVDDVAELVRRIRNADVCPAPGLERLVVAPARSGNPHGAPVPSRSVTIRAGA